MALTGQQKSRLHKALIDSFPTRERLEQMVSFKIDKNLRTITSQGDLEYIVFQLITIADSYGWICELICGACEYNPSNEKLRAVKEELLPNLNQEIFPWYESICALEPISRGRKNIPQQCNANCLWGGDVNWLTAMAFDATNAIINRLTENPDKVDINSIKKLDSDFDGATGFHRLKIYVVFVGIPIILPRLESQFCHDFRALYLFSVKWSPINFS